MNTLSDQQLTSKLNKILTTFKSLSKSICRHNGQINMNNFLTGSADFRMCTAASKVPAFPPTEKDCAVASAEMTAASLRRQLEEVERELAQEKEKNYVFKEISLAHCRTVHLEEEKLVKLKKKFSDLRDQHNLLSRQLNQTRQTIRGIHGSNLYKRLKRKERQLNRKSAVLAEHENGRCERREQTDFETQTKVGTDKSR